MPRRERAEQQALADTIRKRAILNYPIVILLQKRPVTKTLLMSAFGHHYHSIKVELKHLGWPKNKAREMSNDDRPEAYERLYLDLMRGRDGTKRFRANPYKALTVLALQAMDFRQAKSEQIKAYLKLAAAYQTSYDKFKQWDHLEKANHCLRLAYEMVNRDGLLDSKDHAVQEQIQCLEKALYKSYRDLISLKPYYKTQCYQWLKQQGIQRSEQSESLGFLLKEVDLYSKSDGPRRAYLYQLLAQAVGLNPNTKFDGSKSTYIKATRRYYNKRFYEVWRHKQEYPRLASLWQQLWYDPTNPNAMLEIASILTREELGDQAGNPMLNLVVARKLWKLIEFDAEDSETLSPAALEAKQQLLLTSDLPVKDEPLGLGQALSPEDDQPIISLTQGSEPEAIYVDLPDLDYDEELALGAEIELEKEVEVEDVTETTVETTEALNRCIELLTSEDSGKQATAAYYIASTDTADFRLLQRWFGFLNYTPHPVGHMDLNSPISYQDFYSPQLGYLFRGENPLSVVNQLLANKCEFPKTAYVYIQKLLQAKINLLDEDGHKNYSVLAKCEFSLGLIYFMGGYGVERNIPKALSCFEKALVNDHRARRAIPQQAFSEAMKVSVTNLMLLLHSDHVDRDRMRRVADDLRVAAGAVDGLNTGTLFEELHAIQFAITEAQLQVFQVYQPNVVMFDCRKKSEIKTLYGQDDLDEDALLSLAHERQQRFDWSEKVKDPAEHGLRTPPAENYLRKCLRAFSQAKESQEQGYTDRDEAQNAYEVIYGAIESQLRYLSRLQEDEVFGHRNHNAMMSRHKEEVNNFEQEFTHDVEQFLSKAESSSQSSSYKEHLEPLTEKIMDFILMARKQHYEHVEFLKQLSIERRALELVEFREQRALEEARPTAPNAIQSYGSMDESAAGGVLVQSMPLQAHKQHDEHMQQWCDENRPLEPSSPEQTHLESHFFVENRPVTAAMEPKVFLFSYDRVRTHGANVQGSACPLTPQQVTALEKAGVKHDMSALDRIRHKISRFSTLAKFIATVFGTGIGAVSQLLTYLGLNSSSPSIPDNLGDIHLAHIDVANVRTQIKSILGSETLAELGANVTNTTNLIGSELLDAITALHDTVDALEETQQNFDLGNIFTLGKLLLAVMVLYYAAHQLTQRPFERILCKADALHGTHTAGLSWDKFAILPFAEVAGELTEKVASYDDLFRRGRTRKALPSQVPQTHSDDGAPGSDTETVYGNMPMDAASDTETVYGTMTMDPARDDVSGSGAEPIYVALPEGPFSVFWASPTDCPAFPSTSSLESLVDASDDEASSDSSMEAQTTFTTMEQLALDLKRQLTCVEEGSLGGSHAADRGALLQAAGGVAQAVAQLGVFSPPSDSGLRRRNTETVRKAKEAAGRASVFGVFK